MGDRELRDVLARNIRKLINAEARRGTAPSIRAWALGRDLDVRLITRIVNGETAVTLDILDRVAHACGLQAWQLLLPDLDATEPQDAPITEQDRVLLGRLRRLLNDG